MIRAVPIQRDGEVRLTWTHTVSRRPVSEKFAMTADGRMCLLEMAFDHEGPNLPSWPEEGTTWRFEKGRAVVTGYCRCLDRLDLAVSPFGHQLQVGECYLDLTAAIGPDRLVRVTLERIPLIWVYWTEVRQWRHNTSRI